MDTERQEREGEENGSAASSSTEAAQSGELARIHLRVDGMHSTTCETFLESLAERSAGAVDAEASYVTETVRIDYDPDDISPETLSDVLTTAGYTAVLREEASIDATATAAHGDRRLESALGYRYAAGVLFGSFLLLIYVVLTYPGYLSAMLGEGFLPRFSGASVFGGERGLMILPLFLVLTGVVLFFTGLPLLRGAYVSLKVRRPTTELLAALTVITAFVYSIAAVLVGRADVYFDLVIVVAAVVVAAIFYESVAKRQAMDRLTDLTVSRIEEARRYEPDGSPTKVPVDELQKGDRVLVRKGERVPIDGVLAEGNCTVDEAIVTGESLPVAKEEGDEVLGGSVVAENAAVIMVTGRPTSRIDRLIESVWNLQSADHGTQLRANRLAGRLLPVVLIAVAVVALGGLALDGSPVTALFAGLTVLLVGSPWALGLATPLSVATAIEEATRRGIVVFDESVFERLRTVDVVVFDKTGTLTSGEMSVIDAEAPPDLLAAAAAVERRATHPAAAAIADAFPQTGGGSGRKVADGGVADETATEGTVSVESFRSYQKGAEGVVDGSTVLVGHPDLFDRRGWSVSDELLRRVQAARSSGHLSVLVGRDGSAGGLVVVGDEARDHWHETVSRLHDRGCDVVVLTGDTREAAAAFDRHSGVRHVFAEVPPPGKTATVRQLQADRSVAMVGDGTNDASAIAQADLGIALGSGTAIASDAADVAILEDDLTLVETTFDLADAAGKRVSQNTTLALVYNVLAIPIAAVGALNPLTAMGAVVSTCVLLAANSFRSLPDD